MPKYTTSIQLLLVKVQNPRSSTCQKVYENFAISNVKPLTAMQNYQNKSKQVVPTLPYKGDLVHWQLFLVSRRCIAILVLFYRYKLVLKLVFATHCLERSTSYLVLSMLIFKLSFIWRAGQVLTLHLVMLNVNTHCDNYICQRYFWQSVMSIASRFCSHFYHN